MLALASSCEESQPKVEEPTEPWLKDEAERERNEAPSRIRYQVDPGATLSISLPTRRSSPKGRLTRVQGFAEFDLKELALSRGRILVELDSLEMDNLPPPEKAEVKERAPELYQAATQEALRWLGLGENVSREERRKHEQATFEFSSLRSLSHPSAATGSLRKSDGPGQGRQVHATANGELSLGGLAVHRQLPVTMVFHFPEPSTDVPDSVEVTLRSGVLVPLSEYEIVPRGPDGHENTLRRDLIGDLVGSQVKVTGTLKLSRPGAFSPADESEKP